MHGQNIIHDWKFRYLKNYRQRLLASSKNCKTAQAWNVSYEKKLPKGPVPSFALARKEYNQMQCIYFVFCIFYSRMFTCIRSSKNLPGRVNCWISLKFTENITKNFHFHLELIYLMLCDLRNLEFDLVAQGLPEELHYFIFKVP